MLNPLAIDTNEETQQVTAIISILFDITASLSCDH